MSDSKYLLSKIDFSEYGLGTIIPLTIKEIINDLKEENLNIMLAPFLLNCKNDNSECNFFDLLLLSYQDEQLNKQMNNILIQLIDSLKTIYKTDEVKLDIDIFNNINIKINSEISINRDNFDKLCEIVCKMYLISKKQNNEKRVIQVSEENKAILEEYLMLEKQYEKEQAELNKKNQKNLHQLVTIAASLCNWDYDRVLNFTYYRLFNVLNTAKQKDDFYKCLKYEMSYKFDTKNLNYKYWMDVVGKDIDS